MPGRLNETLLSKTLSLAHNVVFVENSVARDFARVVEEHGFDTAAESMVHDLVELYMEVRRKIGAAYTQASYGILLESQIDVGGFPPPSRAQANQLVRRALDKAEIPESIAKLKKWGDIKVKKLLAQGVEHGWSPRKIAKEIGDALGDPRRYRAMVRTAVQQVNNASLADSFENNKGYLRGLQYVATLDTRTCPVCQANDGKIYVYRGKHEGMPDFAEGDAENRPWVPRHPLCRCTYTPVVKSIHEIAGMLNVSVESFPPGARKDINGQIADKLNYAGWLMKQSAEIQRRALGAAKFKLYQRGVPVVAFADKGRALTIEQLKRLAPGQIADVPEVATVPVEHPPVAPAQQTVVTPAPPTPAPVKVTSSRKNVERMAEKIKPVPEQKAGKWPKPDKDYAKQYDVWFKRQQAAMLNEGSDEFELWLDWFEGDISGTTEIESVLHGAPSLPGKYWRGISIYNQRMYKKLTKVGSTVTFDATSSMSKVPEVAADFSTGAGYGITELPRGGRIVFEIRSRTGIDISGLAPEEFEYQKEVLARAGTSYKVRGVKTKRMERHVMFGDPAPPVDVTYIQLEEIDTKARQLNALKSELALAKTKRSGPPKWWKDARRKEREERAIRAALRKKFRKDRGVVEKKRKLKRAAKTQKFKWDKKLSSELEDVENKITKLTGIRDVNTPRETPSVDWHS